MPDFQNFQDDDVKNDLNINENL